jgi:hypothetical protein
MSTRRSLSNETHLEVVTQYQLVDGRMQPTHEDLVVGERWMRLCGRITVWVRRQRSVAGPFLTVLTVVAPL